MAIITQERLRLPVLSVLVENTKINENKPVVKPVVQELIPLELQELAVLAQVENTNLILAVLAVIRLLPIPQLILAKMDITAMQAIIKMDPLVANVQKAIIVKTI